MADSNKIFRIFNTLVDSDIMLKKHIFERLINLIPEDKLLMLADEIELEPPKIGDDEFRSWVKKCRKILKITQEEMAMRIKIRQEELSRFESGKINFSSERRETALNYLKMKINEQYRDMAA